MVESGEELLTQSEPLQRILQKLAAGLVECMLLSRLPTLHVLFPDPSQALGRHRALCRQVAGVTHAETGRAAEMLGAAVISATREAAEVLDDTFDADAWAAVLTEILRPARPAVGNACEVHDIATPRLVRDAERGFPVGGFSSDDPE
jgi:hypothetical protein